MCTLILRCRGLNNIVQKNVKPWFYYIHFLWYWLTVQWPASNFSFQYLPSSTHYGQENTGNYHKLKELLIVKQILLVSIIENVYKTVWRTSILILGCKGLWLININYIPWFCQWMVCYLVSYVENVEPLEIWLSPQEHNVRPKLAFGIISFC